MNHCWLVLEVSTPLNNMSEFVNWDDDIPIFPTEWKNQIHVPAATNQISSITILLYQRLSPLSGLHGTPSLRIARGQGVDGPSFHGFGQLHLWGGWMGNLWWIYGDFVEFSGVFWCDFFGVHVGGRFLGQNLKSPWIPKAWRLGFFREGMKEFRGNGAKLWMTWLAGGCTTLTCAINTGPRPPTPLKV